MAPAYYTRIWRMSSTNCTTRHGWIGLDRTLGFLRSAISSDRRFRGLLRSSGFPDLCHCLANSRDLARLDKLLTGKGLLGTRRDHQVVSAGRVDRKPVRIAKLDFGLKPLGRRTPVGDGEFPRKSSPRAIRFAGARAATEVNTNHWPARKRDCLASMPPPAVAPLVRSYL